MGRMRRIFSLARLILTDGIRRHALLGLILFALAGQITGLVFFEFIPRDIGRASSDYLFSISWLAGLIFLLFHAVNVAAWDEKHHILHTYLSRPISRTEYTIGVFAGLFLLLLFLNIVLCGIGWIILDIIRNSVDSHYFKIFSVNHYILTAIGLLCIELMILSVIIFLSSAVRGGFSVLLLTLSYYFICNGLPVVRETLPLDNNSSSSQFLEVLLKWMSAIFPDFSKLDFKQYVTTLEQLPGYSEIVPVFGLSVLYVIILLWLASLVYQRRDLK